MQEFLLDSRQGRLQTRSQHFSFLNSQIDPNLTLNDAGLEDCHLMDFREVS